MNNILSRILSEVLGARRYKWHGMAVAWVVCAIGWVAVALLPNSYESKAVLHIDTASVLRPLLADLAVNTNVMSEVRMMSEVLLSRPLLESVVRETDLDLRADTPAEMEELLADVRARVSISGGMPRNSFSEQNIYTIKFVDRDPQTVHAVVQSLLDSFVESSLGQNKADSAGAQKFIQEQIQEYEQRLGKAEQELAEFKRANLGLMPSEGQDYYQRLQAVTEDVEDLQDERAEILARRRELQKQLDGEEPSFGLLSPPDSGGQVQVQTVDMSGVEEYERELASLLLRYTEKHPKVVDLRNRIEQIKSQQAQAASAGSSTESRGPQGPVLGTELEAMNTLDRNPVYQNLKMAVSKATADLSVVNEQLSATRSRAQHFRSMVDQVPEIEAQLARLNRDYEVNKAQHTALLRRLQSARLSEEAETQTEDIKFRIIEPPVVPLQATGPNRTLFASVVLVLGFGVGGALAFLLNLLNPVFNSATDVRQVLGLPVLGSIPAFKSKEQKAVSVRSIRRFTYAAIGLIAAYGVAILSWPLAPYIKQIFTGGAA